MSADISSWMPLLVSGKSYLMQLAYEQVEILPIAYRDIGMGTSIALIITITITIVISNLQFNSTFIYCPRFT